MVIIKKKTTLEDVKNDHPETIWYSVATCWWTHRENDLYSVPRNNMPCDPRGSMLMMMPADEFLYSAEDNPSHYGEHGLDAFMASHHDNCVVSPFDDRSTCLQTWQEYNDLIDNHVPPVVR